MRGSVREGERVLLRPLRPTDAGPLGQILRDGRVTRWLPARVRAESGRQFVRRVLTEQRGHRGVPFAILRRESGGVVGQIRFFGWSHDERRAELGYWLQRRWWGHGYASEAARLTSEFGFASMRLHRIDANVVAGNRGSERVLAKVGFRNEGVRREATRLARAWGDLCVYGLLRADFVRAGSRLEATGREGSPAPAAFYRSERRRRGREARISV